MPDYVSSVEEQEEDYEYIEQQLSVSPFVRKVESGI